jgi:hypothetical protein
MGGVLTTKPALLTSSILIWSSILFLTSLNGATKQPKQHPNHIDSQLLHLQLAINICPSLASGADAGLLQQSQ